MSFVKVDPSAQETFAMFIHPTVANNTSIDTSTYH